MVVKKGQLKIQQMAFMLIAVIVFFILVGMFVLVIRFAGLKDTASLIEEENALLLVAKIANSPEFSCGESFGTGKTNCVDADKLMMLKKNIKNYNDLSSERDETFWGVETNIEIRRIYPKGKGVECTQGNYPRCDVINLLSKPIESQHENFVTLCRKEASEDGFYDKCELAKIMVNYQEWE